MRSPKLERRERELTLHQHLRSATELAQLLVKMQSGIENRDTFKRAAEGILAASAVARARSAESIVNPQPIFKTACRRWISNSFRRPLQKRTTVEVRLELAKATDDLEAKREAHCAIEQRSNADAEAERTVAEASKIANLEEEDASANNDAMRLVRRVDASLENRERIVPESKRRDGRESDKAITRKVVEFERPVDAHLEKAADQREADHKRSRTQQLRR